MTREYQKDEPDKITLMVILYLIEKLNGVLGKTHLQKILFLISLLSVKKNKESLIKKDIEEKYVKYLEKKGLIEQKKFPLGRDEDKICIRYYSKHRSSIKKQLFKKIGAENLLFLDDIISSYGNICLQEILDIAYSLQTVKKSKLHTPLEMAQIIKEDNNEVEEIDIL